MTNENNLDIDIAVLSKQWPPLKQNIKKLAAKTMELSGFTKKHKNKSGYVKSYTIKIYKFNSNYSKQ